MKLKRDYRVASTSVAKLKPENRPWAVIENIWYAYAGCPKTQLATFLKRLTPGQKAFVALNGLEAEVNNGGIHQYLWNGTGDLFPEALAGLELIGAQAHLKLLRKVAGLFPDPAVLKSRRRRQKVLAGIKTSQTDKLFDAPFYDLEERKRSCLGTLRLKYLKAHPEEFVLPAGQAEESLLTPSAQARDYRVSRKKVETLRGEKLHWALIAKVWDEYWEPLKAGKQQIVDFLPALSKGQRALIAIDILNKNVLHLGGLVSFFGTQAGADVLTAEAAAGFHLLKARPYQDLFKRAIAVGGDLTRLGREVAEAHSMVSAAKQTGAESAIQAARQNWNAVFNQKRKREAALAESLEALTEQFAALLQSPDKNIERFLEAYVDAHPGEFMR